MAPPQPISIYIADTQPVFRHGLRLLLAAEPDLAVVGSTSTVADLLRSLRQLEPSVLFLDSALSATWLDLLRDLTTERPNLHVIVTGTAQPEEDVLAGLERGARGFLARDAAVDLFPRCVRAVFSGQYWVGRQAVAGLVQGLRRARTRADERHPHLALTGRQLAVLRAVASSQTNREIAAALGISEDTVKQHLTAIYDKCGVSTRVELALFAVRNQLID